MSDVGRGEGGRPGLCFDGNVSGGKAARGMSSESVADAGLGTVEMQRGSPALYLFPIVGCCHLLCEGPSDVVTICYSMNAALGEMLGGPAAAKYG